MQHECIVYEVTAKRVAYDIYGLAMDPKYHQVLEEMGTVCRIAATPTEGESVEALWRRVR